VTWEAEREREREREREVREAAMGGGCGRWLGRGQGLDSTVDRVTCSQCCRPGTLLMSIQRPWAAEEQYRDDLHV
jgi:hypothetical protein